MGQQAIGKMLMLLGALLLLAGIFFYFSGRLPGFLGKLPGDIRFERPNFNFYFPITTSILLSLLISFVIYLIQRFK